MKKQEPIKESEQVKALREQIAKAESKGLFDTAHHDMLKQILAGEDKSKENINNG